MPTKCRFYISKHRLHVRLGLKYLLLAVFSFWTIILSQVIIFAQSPTPSPSESPTQPKVRATSVTASVPDTTAPSVPILVSPVNNSLLTTNHVAFIWEASVDNIGVDNYQLWVDGQLIFANLNPLGETNDQYHLLVNGNQLSLIPVMPQTEGGHTWKIVAVDAANNQSSSATWQFTVDTQAPTFLITLIDAFVVSISSQDLSTIPSNPIQLVSSQPYLSGLGEANSTGVISITITGQSPQIQTFNVGANGQWQTQLPSIPYDKIVILNFTITDLAGNVSVISDLKLIRPSAPIATQVPSSVVTSGAPTQVTTTPTTTPIFPWPVWPPISLPVVPTPSAPPSIIIPGLPPIPIPIPSPIQPIAKQVTRISQTPRALLAQMMPISMEASWQRQKLTLISPVSAVLETLGWLWLSLPLLVSLIWLSRFVPNSLSLIGFRQILWALDMDKSQKPQGVVLSLPSVKPLPFATLITVSKLKNGQTIISYRLSNRFGEYLPTQLQIGKHRLVVESPGHYFPAVFNAPTHTKMSSFYLGESWQNDDKNIEPKLIVPLLKTDQPSRRVPPEWLIKLTHQQGKAVAGQFMLILMTLIFVPSLLNGLALLTLLILITKSGLKRSKQSHQLARVYNRQLEPMDWGAIIIGEEVSQQQVYAIWHGQLTHLIGDRYVAASPVLCQAVTNQNGRVLLTEDVCSVQKDQMVV